MSIFLQMGESMELVSSPFESKISREDKQHPNSFSMSLILLVIQSLTLDMLTLLNIMQTCHGCSEMKSVNLPWQVAVEHEFRRYYIRLDIRSWIQSLRVRHFADDADADFAGRSVSILHPLPDTNAAERLGRRRRSSGDLLLLQGINSIYGRKFERDATAMTLWCNEKLTELNKLLPPSERIRHRFPSDIATSHRDFALTVNRTRVMTKSLLHFSEITEARVAKLEKRLMKPAHSDYLANFSFYGCGCCLEPSNNHTRVLVNGLKAMTCCFGAWMMLSPLLLAIKAAYLPVECPMDPFANASSNVTTNNTAHQDDPIFPWLAVFAPGFLLLVPWVLLLPLIFGYDYVTRWRVRHYQERLFAAWMVLLKLHDPSRRLLKFDSRVFIIRGASLWIACVTICAVILANWLLLDHPGVYPDIFALNAGCAQSVIITAGTGLVLTCFYMGTATTYFVIKEEIVCKVVRPLLLVWLIRVGLPITTPVMASVRICGLAPDLPVAVIMSAGYILIIASIVTVVWLNRIFLTQGALRCDTERGCASSALIISGWSLLLTLIACIVLMILNIDMGACINWGFVAAPSVVLTASAFFYLYLLLTLRSFPPGAV